MNLKPLPIGIQSFDDLIMGGFLYVDKTHHLFELIKKTKGAYFLSRPRRFGKSLTVSTLDAIFSGKRELFTDLTIGSQDYDWKPYPVLRFDLSKHQPKDAQALNEILVRSLRFMALQWNLRLPEGTCTELFDYLLTMLDKTHGKVVVLIDEYDKPILDHLGNVAIAAEMREFLKAFYGILKSADEHLRFVFITGVSRFSKTGVFSGLNNLRDLTLIDSFADMLGYTQEELELHFSDYIDILASSLGLDRPLMLDAIRDWYNGFRFTSREISVYNPFSSLLLFENKKFMDYWFESGTPTFLLELLRQRSYNIASLEALRLQETALSSYEIETLAVEPLLFQTGYLTIKNYEPYSGFYTLSYPNREVQRAFADHLAGTFTAITKELAPPLAEQLVTILKTGNLEEYFNTLQSFFLDLPYDLTRREEQYFQSIFFLIHKLLGFQIQCEVKTSRGRIDAAIVLSEDVWVFEFKLDGNADKALQQILQMGYMDKYKKSGKRVHGVGVGFNQQKREISRWVSTP